MRAWVLNLDAEDELEGRRPYRSPLAALAARPQLLSALTSLVRPGDVVVDAERPQSLSGWDVRAWCPTPAARSLVASRGGVLDGPPVAVLREVSSRRFSAKLGLALEDSAWFEDAEAALAHLHRRSPTGTWLVRRAYGFAGRGRRLVGEVLRTADMDFVRRAARDGGVLVEPLVERRGDFGLHGSIGSDGLVLGRPVVSEVDRAGVWRGTRGAEPGDLRRDELDALDREARRTAEALICAGYWGPFGVDAFRYLWSGRERFSPRCEINPRHSMGWGIGMSVQAGPTVHDCP